MTLNNGTALLAFLVVSFAITPLFAQTADNAAAGRALFNEARKLAAAGKYADACPKFEESLRLNRGIGTQFNLADCLERIGKTASAWGHFLEVAAAARASGQSDREAVARDRAAALEPKLARLVIQVDDHLEGLNVQRDGVLVGAAAYGTATPVDPGNHTVVATAPGRKNWSSDVLVPAGPGTVSLRVPALESDSASAAPVAAAAKNPPSTPESPADEKGTGLGTERTLALAAAGIGVAGAIAGTVFFVQYQGKNSDAEDICPSPASPCPPGSAATHAALVEDARKARTLTYVGWGVGAAGLAGAAILWFVAPEDKGAAATAGAWKLETLALPSGAGASLRGSF